MKFEELLTADDHEAGAEMNVLHPVTGVPTDVYIMVKGIDSKTFRDASIQFNRKRIEGKADDDHALDLTVAITCGWRGIDGVDFSPEKARELYRDSPAIRAQVDEFFTKRRNFTKG